MSAVDDLLRKNELNVEDITTLLSLTNDDDIIKLYTKAYEVKERYVGKKVYFRGLIEFSNICTKNCYYCGIRRDNKNVSRYVMTEEEVYEAVDFAYQNGYASIVFQSGEREDPVFVEKITEIIKNTKARTEGKLGITLSVGEQTEETYRAFYEAGAHRYLLRIETSNPYVYRKIHPEDHNFERRISCITTLRDVGYQVGTGVMIGFPFQTLPDLVKDLLFFREMDIDMVGMGPYIEHENTPLHRYVNTIISREERFTYTLKMIALLRIMMKDINIAATTALQALDPLGREKGISAGANVVMPNLTPSTYRESYLLYEGKPCVQDTSDECKSCLERRINSIGENVGYNEWGDSPHYFARTKKGDATTGAPV